MFDRDDYNLRAFDDPALDDYRAEDRALRRLTRVGLRSWDREFDGIGEQAAILALRDDDAE